MTKNLALTRRTVAFGLAGVIAVGGGIAGSLAYFGDQTETTTSTITTGDIDVSAAVTTTEVNGNAVPSLAAYRVSPGDVVTISSTADVVAGGDDMLVQVEFDTDAPGLEALGADVDIDFTATARTGSVVVPSVTPGAFEMTHDGVVEGGSFAASTASTITVSIPSGGTVDNTLANAVGTISFSTIATQVLPAPTETIALSFPASIENEVFAGRNFRMTATDDRGAVIAEVDGTIPTVGAAAMDISGELTVREGELPEAVEVEVAIQDGVTDNFTLDFANFDEVSAKHWRDELGLAVKTNTAVVGGVETVLPVVEERTYFNWYALVNGMSGTTIEGVNQLPDFSATLRDSNGRVYGSTFVDVYFGYGVGHTDWRASFPTSEKPAFLIFDLAFADGSTKSITGSWDDWVRDRWTSYGPRGGDWFAEPKVSSFVIRVDGYTSGGAKLPFD